jgi:hypothetical protein
MNADAKLDAPIVWNACVPLKHRVLDFEGAAHRVDHAAELDNCAIAGALDDSAMMHRDSRIDQVAAQCSKAREDAILVRAREARVADDVGH